MLNDEFPSQVHSHLWRGRSHQCTSEVHEFLHSPFSIGVNGLRMMSHPWLPPSRALAAKALPGPFDQSAIDPHALRLVALGGVRGLIATAQGPVVLGPEGRLPIDVFITAPLPAANGTVIVDDRFCPPDPAVVARVQAALAL